MTDKKNEPGIGKDAPRITDPAQPRRPQAMLDLKATEIDVKPVPDTSADTAAKSAPAPESASKPQASSTPIITPVKPGESSKANDVPKSEAKAETKASDTRAANSSPSPAVPPAKASNGSTFGRFVSHVSAAALGGILALLGADWFAPQLGFSTSRADLNAMSTAYEQKFAALEAALKDKAAGGEITKKLQNAESRLAELEKLGPAIGTLSDAQAKLAQDAKSFSEKLAADASDTGPAARVAKLQERLDTMAAAAATSPNAGTLPQLAAITGRMGDLEGEVAKQLADLRKTLNQEIDTKLEGVTTSSNAAKSGTDRLDDDFASLKTETTKLGERIDSLKTESDRLGEAVRLASEETTAVKAASNSLKSELENKFKASAKPDDVTTAIAPITGKLAALEQSLAGVVRSEEDRKANAERIVLSLELQNLKRALERGAPFGAELAEVEKAAAGRIDLTGLQPFKDKGVTPLTDLQKDFKGVLYLIIDADTQTAEGSVLDQLLSGAKSVVKVRKISHTPDDQSAEAVVARMENALKNGQLDNVMAESKKLSEKAAAPAKAWLANAEARATVEAAVAKIEGDLKASIGGQAAPDEPAPARE